jgi:hypothetical protein
MILETPLFT